MKPTYEEFLIALKPPVKCVYDNKDWVMTENKDGQYKLIPCRCDINNGETIYVPHGTILTHIICMNYA